MAKKIVSDSILNPAVTVGPVMDLDPEALFKGEIKEAAPSDKKEPDLGSAVITGVDPIAKTITLKSAPPVEIVMNFPTDDVPHMFSGLARSVLAYDNQGFRNFRIVTLTIEENQIKKIEYSDPYASFEAIARMELWNEMSILNLNNNWKPGKTLVK